MSKEKAADLLTRQVYARGRYREYGELDAEDAGALADELSAKVGGGGVDAKLGPVARAWRELAERLEERGLSAVSELPADEAAAFAERVWVVPPGGGLLEAGTEPPEAGER